MEDNRINTERLVSILNSLNSLKEESLKAFNDSTIVKEKNIYAAIGMITALTGMILKRSVTNPKILRYYVAGLDEIKITLIDENMSENPSTIQ